MSVVFCFFVASSCLEVATGEDGRFFHEDDDCTSARTSMSSWPNQSPPGKVQLFPLPRIGFSWSSAVPVDRRICRYGSKLNLRSRHLLISACLPFSDNSGATSILSSPSRRQTATCRRFALSVSLPVLGECRTIEPSSWARMPRIGTFSFVNQYESFRGVHFLPGCRTCSHSRNELVSHSFRFSNNLLMASCGNRSTM